MNILVFSLGVVFKEAVQGGSQKVLRDISCGLALRGHKVTIICPKRKDNDKFFEMCRGVTVKPILPLREAFPMPYSVPPFSLVETCRLIEEEVWDKDLLYCHDGGLLIESIKNFKPVVISLRDFCYHETLLGALNFKGEVVVVNSLHTYLCLQDSFMQVNPFLKGKVRVIYNGYDSTVLRRKSISNQFYETYGFPQKRDKLIIGFPHRPEMSKGFHNALQVLKQLTDTFGEQVKLLIPLYMDRGLSDRTDDTYRHTRAIIEDYHLQDNVIYHNWVRHEEMAEYYSYCDVVLCIGNFVEAFSNVSVEALLCGTPVVSANTSTYRTMPIRRFLHLVPYGEIDKTVQVVRDILCGRNSVTLTETMKEARAFIAKEFTVNRMIDAYEQVFLHVQTMKATEDLSKVYDECRVTSSSEKYYKIPAWCEVSDGKIYNDYRGEYMKDPFNGKVSRLNEIFTKRELILCGVGEEEIECAITDGLLIECR